MRVLAPLLSSGLLGLAASSRDNLEIIGDLGGRGSDFSLYKRLRLRGIGHMADEEQSLEWNL